MAEDFYKTLGVARNASQAEIQKAYFDLAKKYHPDKNPDDKSAVKKFQKVQAAFDVLGNAEKREMYDRYGSSFGSQRPGGGQSYNWTGQQPGGGFAGGFNPEDIDFSQFFGDRFGEGAGGAAGANAGAAGFGGFSDIFKQFKRANPGRPQRASSASTSRRGADISHTIQVPFTTSINGGEAQLSVQRQSGKVDAITVKIPPGIESGKKIRIRGQGEPAPRGGTPGDILLTVHVDAHPYYQRRGNHLVVRLPVTLAEAAAGAKIDVPTPRGTVTLNVPAGSSSGVKLRVKGYGITPKNGTPGDLLAEVSVVLPKNISESDRKLLCEIDKRYEQQPRHDLHW